MSKKQGIYIFTCKTNNSVYVGESFDLDKREKDHFNKLSNNSHHVKELQSLWNENKPSDFVFEILEEKNNFPKKQRVEREVFWIEKLKKISSINVLNIKFGNALTEEIKNKISKSLKGHEVTKESRVKMSEAKRGKEPYNKFPITDELIQDIKDGISYKSFEEKYNKTKNTLKRIKKELNLVINPNKKIVITNEMIEDAKLGITQTQWKEKHNSSENILKRLKKELGLIK